MLIAPENPSLQPPRPFTGRLMEVALACQRALASEPRQPSALATMSLVALASHQPEAAVAMAAAAVEAAPRMGVTWVTLGQALKVAGRAEEAEQAYNAAIRLDGMNPLARLGRGELLIALGRPGEAIAEFELALRKAPALAAAHMGLSHALAYMDRNGEALACYQRVLELRPRLAEAEFAAAFVLARLGRQQQAERGYRRALACRPNFAAAWVNLGNLLHEQGRDFAAEAALRRAVELDPNLVSAWVNLAQFERDRGRRNAASADLSHAFALNPDQVETLVACCQVRVAEGDPAGAWGWLRWALARNPEHAEALNMYGILLHNERRFEEAIVQFERAEAWGHKAAASNRGNSLLDLGRMAEALRAHQSAAERDPASPGAAYNLALTRIRLGDWERGWPGYEARWRFREVHKRPRVFDCPRWQGEPLGGQRVLLHAEQGLGDTLQFCRYAALVAARGGFPVVAVQRPLLRLLGSLAVARAGQAQIAGLLRFHSSSIEVALPSSGQFLETAESEVGIDSEAGLSEGRLKFDLECPLMSLPAVFRTTVDTAPWTGPYLASDPERAFAKRLKVLRFAGAAPLRVGLAWAGNPGYKADMLRSVQLDTLLPLLRTPGVGWVSLQKGPATAQLALLPAEIRVLDGSSEDADLAETAAMVATLDLIVTTDTCIAHLAGAMGKPVWILLPHLSDWRWMQDVETTPWYPTARLFRQNAPGDWVGAMERVTAALQVLERSPSRAARAA